MRAFLKRLMPYIVGFSILFVYLYYTTVMPGESYKGPIIATDKELQAKLEQHVRMLTMAERNQYLGLTRSRDYIVADLKSKGFEPILQTHKTDNIMVSNIEVIIPGQIKDTVVIGAHYDSINGTVGANDNASGVAGLLELAQSFKNPHHSIRLVWFVNEEPPYFKTHEMGSYIYVEMLDKEKVPIVAAYSFDMIGSYYEAPNTQRYPPPMNFFYPNTGNFIGFVGNQSSRSLVSKSVLAFRESGAKIGSEAVAAPSFIRGTDYSDNWSFYQFGYKALMVTDTSFNRYGYYHTEGDTIDKLNFPAMSVTVSGLREMFRKLYVVQSKIDE